MHYPSRNALLYLFLAVFGLASTIVGWQDLMESRRPWYSGFFSSTPTAKFSLGPFRFQFVLNEEGDRDDTEAGGTLTISQFGREEVLRPSPGDSFRVNDASASVIAIRPYVGLWPDPQGVPMAGISIRRNGVWTENIALQSAERLTVQNGLAIRFLWCADEAEARRRADEGRPGIESARWGIRDTTRTHWSNSFTPGTGVEIDDGTVVTFIGLFEDIDGGASGIEVEIRNRDSVNRRRILPSADDPLVIFDFPASNREILLLYAWSEDHVLLSYLPHGGDSVRADLPVGGEWESGGEALAIRLEQISHAALQVSHADSGLSEALLQIAGLRVRVREGQAVRVGDALLRYSRDAAENSAQYHMTYTSSGGDERHFALSADHPFRFSTPDGAFALHHRDVHPGVGLRIWPEHRFVPYRLWIGIIVLGFAIIMLVRLENQSR